MSFEFVSGFNVMDYFDFSHYVHERPRGTNMPIVIWRCRLCNAVVDQVNLHFMRSHPDIYYATCPGMKRAGSSREDVPA